MSEQQYHRLSVNYIDEFCGWDAIDELLKYASKPVEERYLLCAIKTGGRSRETLSLMRENFEYDKRRKALRVINMKLEKRWVSKKDPVTKKPVMVPTGKLDPETQKPILKRETIRITSAVRKPFPISLKEPLSDRLFVQIESVPKGYLFASPYKAHDPLTRDWGYKFVRNLSDTIPAPLFRKLGLNQPFKDSITGTTIADKIHLWQHWFRSQRASQLRSEHEFTEADLMEFFGWLDYKTALHYSKAGASRLADKMNQTYNT